MSDASGSWGCGAYWGQEWFQVECAGTSVESASIAVKELLPLVIAVPLWGSRWKGATVMCRCDNEAVVEVITTMTAHDKRIMQLLWCLFLLEARFDCHLLASHIPGIHNELADHLSRNRASVFQPRPRPLARSVGICRTWSSASMTGRPQLGGVSSRLFSGGSSIILLADLCCRYKKKFCLLHPIQTAPPIKGNPVYTVLLCVTLAKHWFGLFDNKDVLSGGLVFSAHQ